VRGRCGLELRCFLRGARVRMWDAIGLKRERARDDGGPRFRHHQCACTGAWAARGSAGVGRHHFRGTLDF
jgi:hypothetical protein